MSKGHTKFKRNVSFGSGAEAVAQLPLEPDAWWLEQLGTVFGERVAESDAVLFTTETGVSSSILQRRAELAYWASAIGCGPTGRPAHLMRGEESYGRAAIREVSVLPVYRYAEGLSPRPWCPPLLKLSAKVFAGLLAVDNQNDAPRRLRRGLNALFRALSSTILQDRLHEHVRALSSLMDMPKGNDTHEFANRLKTFCSSGSDTASYTKFHNLYDLRNKIEHMCDPEETEKTRLPDSDFTMKIESQTRLAEKAALRVYQRVLGDQSLLAVFGDVGHLKHFWALPEKDRQAIWGRTMHVDGRVRRA
jgi:hypothetical protein